MLCLEVRREELQGSVMRECVCDARPNMRKQHGISLVLPRQQRLGRCARCEQHSELVIPSGMLRRFNLTNNCPDIKAHLSAAL
jgi:hypothetical protein